MYGKKAGFLCGIIFSFLPFASYATDIYLKNNTNAFMTGSKGFLCSTNVPGGGSLGPKGDVTIKESDIGKLCPFGTCKVDIHMTDNCSGDVVSTVWANKSDGVTGIKNYGVDGYAASGGGGYLVMNGPARKWYNFFTRIFS